MHNGRVRSDEGRGSAWWSRSRGLSKTVYESWKTSLHGQANRPTRILGWAKTPTGFCIASPAAFSFGDQLAWEHLGWHEIERGGWNAELNKLSWVRYAAPGEAPTHGVLELTEPGRVAGAISGTNFGNHRRREVRPAGRRTRSDHRSPSGSRR